MARKVLVVDRDSERVEALTLQLERAGLAVSNAPDGLYALTAVERDPPDLVLLCGGSDAFETCEILRSDPGLAEVKVGFYLDDPDETLSDVYDLTISGPVSTEFVATRVRRFISDLPTGGPRAADEPQQGEPEVDPLRNALSGTLEVLNLVELIQVLCQGRQHGRLCLLFDGSLAEVCIDDARVVHASFDGLSGREAIVATLAAGEAERDAEFWFESMAREETFRFPRTINMSVQQLLLSIAVDSDESSESSQRGA